MKQLVKLPKDPTAPLLNARGQRLLLQLSRNLPLEPLENILAYVRSDARNHVR